MRAARLSPSPFRHALLGICLLIQGCAPAPKAGPELILTGGRIRLGDLDAPVVAVAIGPFRHSLA